MCISKGHRNLSLKPKNQGTKKFTNEKMGLRKKLLKNGDIPRINSTLNMIQLSMVMHV
jgi:hypothetical protein